GPSEGGPASLAWGEGLPDPPYPPRGPSRGGQGHPACCQLPGVEDGDTGAGCGGRATMSLASFVPRTTRPPTQTGVRSVSALWRTFPWRSRTTVVLARSQVQLVPSLALTVMDFPVLTDWITPRSNASVLMPLRVCTVNWPSTPRSRKNARTRLRTRRQCAAPAPIRRPSLGSPARCAARETRRARAQTAPFAAPAPRVSGAPAAVRPPGAEASLSVWLSSALSCWIEVAGRACRGAAPLEAAGEEWPASLIPAITPPP